MIFCHCCTQCCLYTQFSTILSHSRVWSTYSLSFSLLSHATGHSTVSSCASLFEWVFSWVLFLIMFFRPQVKADRRLPTCRPVGTSAFTPSAVGTSRRVKADVYIKKYSNGCRSIQQWVQANTAMFTGVETAIWGAGDKALFVSQPFVWDWFSFTSLSPL